MTPKIASLWEGGTMGCHPMLTKNANFITNALRVDLSTVNVRNWCGHHSCSLHQWNGNWILPQFDPRMSSLALLEPEIPYPLAVTGKNNVDVLVLFVTVVAFLFSCPEQLLKPSCPSVGRLVGHVCEKVTFRVL